MTPEEADAFLNGLNTAIDGGVASYRNDRALNPDLSDGQFLHQFGRELAEAVRSGGADMDQVAYTAAAALARIASLTGDVSEPDTSQDWPPHAGDVWHLFPIADADGWCGPWEPWHAAAVHLGGYSDDDPPVVGMGMANLTDPDTEICTPDELSARGKMLLVYREADQ